MAALPPPRFGDLGVETLAPLRPLPRFESVRFVVPVRLAAWLGGDLGKKVVAWLLEEIDAEGARIERLPRSLLVSGLDAGDLETVLRACRRVEGKLRDAYPIFWKELGAFWTGTVQALPFDADEGVAA